MPFGPGAGADIGARLFAEKLQTRWGQPVVIENRPGGDSIVAITAFLSANDDHTFLFAPAGNFAVHPFVYSKLSYDPKDIFPIARVSNTILAMAVKQDAPYKNAKEFTEAVRKEPGKFNSGLVQGITEFTFWGYEYAERSERSRKCPTATSTWRQWISAKAASRWSWHRSRSCNRNGKPAGSGYWL